jgi:hypothetical protein
MDPDFISIYRLVAPSGKECCAMRKNWRYYLNLFDRYGNAAKIPKSPTWENIFSDPQFIGKDIRPASMELGLKKQLGCLQEMIGKRLDKDREKVNVHANSSKDFTPLQDAAKQG